MPRYHLNLYLDEEIPDEEGIDRPDLASATAEAEAGGLSLLSEQLLLRRPLNLSHRIEVTDETGRVLATVTFREMVTIMAE